MDTKKCTRCKEVKPLSAYYPVGNGIKGVRPRCKECMRILERAKYDSDEEFRIAKLSSQAERHRNDPVFRAAHRHSMRRWHLKNAYGLSMEDFALLVQRQNGGCAICGSKPIPDTPKTRLVVDHCHRTGKIRGILCDLCNTAIGKLQDDPHLLRAAADYLMDNS